MRVLVLTETFLILSRI